MDLFIAKRIRRAAIYFNMIKTIAKYYLKFPPLMRSTIKFSLNGLMMYAGVDYFHSDPSDVLLECGEVINQTLFI